MDHFLHRTRAFLTLAILGMLAIGPSCSSGGSSEGGGAGGFRAGEGANGGTAFGGGLGAGFAGAGIAMAGSSGEGGGSSNAVSGGQAGLATSGGNTAVAGSTGVGGFGGSGFASGGSTAGGSTAVGGSNAGGSTASGGSSGAVGGGSDPNSIDVYLIAGQSNATGQGYTKNYPAGFSINTMVQLYHSPDIKSSTAGDVWGPLRYASEGPDGCGNRFGPELGFGNNIQALFPNRQIAIIKHAKSGTNLVSQWAPGSSPADSTHFGPEFRTFVSTVDSGIKALQDKGMKPTIRGMLWQQGEKDADLGGTASSQYGQNLSALIARVRAQWSASDMLFIYGYVYPQSNFGTGRDEVRQGEANVDQNSGSALAVKGAFVVLTDDLELRADDPNSCYKSDKIHFGTAGQIELGKRMATKLHDHLMLL